MRSVKRLDLVFLALFLATAVLVVVVDYRDAQNGESSLLFTSQPKAGIKSEPVPPAGSMGIVGPLPKSDSSLPKYSYPELTARALIRFADDKETYRPMFWIKFGTTDHQNFTLYTPKKDSRVFWQKEVWSGARVESKTEVSYQSLPGNIAKLTLNDLRKIAVIVADDRGNYLLSLKNDENFEKNFKFWQALVVLYPEYCQGYC